MSRQIKIALVGQPNVGKSHLINAITGASLHVGNFSGVTVEKKEVRFERGGYDISIIDLPGLYSLNAYSPDEEVTKNYLLNESYDVIVNVLDANALSRNLALTLQIAEMDKKMLLAVNMIDEVEKNGGFIDAAKLTGLLGLQTLTVSAKQKRGIEELVGAVIRLYEAEKQPSKIVYDHRIEEEISPLVECLQRDSEFAARARFISIRLLEGDKQLYRLVHDKPVFLEFHDLFKEAAESLKTSMNEDDTPSVMINARTSFIRGVTSKTVKVPHKDSVTERIDKILIHPILGIPIFLFFMWGLFQLTFTAGALPQEMIQGAFGQIADVLKKLVPQNALSQSITDGFIPSVGAILSFLPNILILFLGINLLEQTGYMSRAAFLMDGIMKKFGLQGKAFIPLVSGFGCSIPAYMAARTLKNPKDKIITMLVIGFMSCSARLPVYVLFIGAFFAANKAGSILFAIYITGAILGMVVAKILRTILFKGEAEPFVMEMPKYRLPSLKAVVRDLRIKTTMFVKKAGLFIGLTSMAIWFLSAYPANEEITARYEAQMSLAVSVEQNKTLELALKTTQLENSYIGRIGSTIQPIFAPLGFDWRLSVATVSALAAKEVAVATLATLYSVESAGDEPSQSLIAQVRANIDFKAAMAFIVLVMIYSPCIAAMSTFFSEVPQWAWRAFYLVYPNVVAWILAFIVYSVLSIAGF